MLRVHRAACAIRSRRAGERSRCCAVAVAHACRASRGVGVLVLARRRAGDRVLAPPRRRLRGPPPDRGARARFKSRPRLKLITTSRPGFAMTSADGCRNGYPNRGADTGPRPGPGTQGAAMVLEMKRPANRHHSHRDCVHHWVIESQDRSPDVGSCKRCGTTRTFAPSVPTAGADASPPARGWEEAAALLGLTSRRPGPGRFKDFALADEI